jgi:predicted permease
MGTTGFGFVFVFVNSGNFGLRRSPLCLEGHKNRGIGTMLFFDIIVSFLKAPQKNV